MSTAKTVSSVASVTSLAPTTDYALIVRDGAMKRILPKRFNFIDVSKKEAAESTMGVVDFFRKYGSTATPGTIIGDQLYSNAVVWKVNLGNVTVDLQSYYCVVMRNENGLRYQWSYVSLYFIPCNANHLSTFRVTLSVGTDVNSVKRTVARVCTAEVTLSDTVSMGGITSYPISCCDSSEGRWQHERGKNSCGCAERSSDSRLCFGSFDSLVQYIGRTCQDWKEDSSERIKQRKSRCKQLQGNWCDLSAEYGMHKLPYDRYQRSNPEGQRTFIFLSRSGISENKHKSLSVYQKLQKRNLEQLVQSADGESHHIADRKEVVAA